jgi:hypothetical protein
MTRWTPDDILHQSTTRAERRRQRPACVALINPDRTRRLWARLLLRRAAPSRSGIANANSRETQRTGDVVSRALRTGARVTTPTARPKGLREPSSCRRCRSQTLSAELNTIMPS